MAMMERAKHGDGDWVMIHVDSRQEWGCRVVFADNPDDLIVRGGVVKNYVNATLCIGLLTDFTDSRVRPRRMDGGAYDLRRRPGGKMTIDEIDAEIKVVSDMLVALPMSDIEWSVDHINSRKKLLEIRSALKDIANEESNRPIVSETIKRMECIAEAERIIAAQNANYGIRIADK